MTDHLPKEFAAQKNSRVLNLLRLNEIKAEHFRALKTVTTISALMI